MLDSQPHHFLHILDLEAGLVDGEGLEVHLVADRDELERHPIQLPELRADAVGFHFAEVDAERLRIEGDHRLHVGDPECEAVEGGHTIISVLLSGRHAI